MHPNPAFRTEPREQNIAFVREQGFGMLAVATEDAPLVSHVPFLLSEDGGLAELHLVRSNPIVGLLKQGPCAVRLAVQGPQGYISPDWYGVEDQVPTWNYVAVHLVGELSLGAMEGLRDLLDRQSALFEERLLPKPPWTTAKMSPEVMDRMMRQIVPCAIRVDEIDGTWKLGQNKPAPARQGAADQLDASGLGQEPRLLAALMRGV
ncbi:FMN-binding negative transcriptional regulator [Roseovarius sp. E0-M6]|uniref:FMN-binding negative transcriptional regulator n=1 Tax=Roseovarius sp. E0-M6 TaxID=3127118 RepID=UPI00300FE666